MHRNLSVGYIHNYKRRNFSQNSDGLVLGNEDTGHTHTLVGKRTMLASEITVKGENHRASHTVPTHIEVTATRLSVRRSSAKAVTTWRAPVAPKG